MTRSLRVKTAVRAALSLCALTLFASVALAQPPGGPPLGGQNGPPLFGGPPNGGQGRPGAPRQASAVDVPMEMLSAGLNLTADQKARIASIQQQFRSQRPPAPPQEGPEGGPPNGGGPGDGPPPPGGFGGPGGQNGQQGGPPDQDAQRAQMDKARSAQQQASRKIEAILTDQQKQVLPALLKELDALRATGIPANLYGDLKLSAAQKARITAIAQKSQQQMRAQMDKARQGGDFDSVRAAMQQGRRQAHEDAMAALTAEQRQLIQKQARNRPPGEPGDGPPPPGGFGGPGGGDGPPPPPDGQDGPPPPGIEL